MLIFRKLLKSILGILARWAIKKHNIELIVVTGFYGSELVKEGIYEILNQKFKIRRSTDQILWDMALPLAVLGYEDRRRNVFEWIFLIIRAVLYLAGGPKNKHSLVLNANCTFSDTARFWSSFLKPDYLIILNYEKDSAIIDTLLSSINYDNGVLIYHKNSVDEEKLHDAHVKKKFSFGTKKEDADFTYNSDKHTLQYKRQIVKVPPTVPSVIIPHMAAIFALAVNHRLSLEEAGTEALKFDLGSILVKKIKTNFGKEGPY